MDLNVLNSLAAERNALQEEVRELSLRASTAERKLAAIDTDQAQARKALEQRDEAVRRARKSQNELKVAQRELELKLGIIAHLEAHLTEAKEKIPELESSISERLQEIDQLKDGANMLSQAQEAELRKLRERVLELEPLKFKVANFIEAFNRLIG